MDNVARLDVDDSLVPPAYMAWTLWDGGDRPAAVEKLGALLRKQFGGEALGNAERLLDRSGYQSLFAHVLAEPLALSVAPAAVAAAIWRQAPRDVTLSALLLGDYRWSEDPFETDITEVPQADVLTGLLREHESAGLLSRDAEEVPFGGRPVLTKDLLAAAEGDKIGVIQVSMETPVEDPHPAEEWWATAAATMPRLVIRTFLHDAFVPENGRSGNPSETWQLIRDRHPAYASAIIAAWTTLEGDVSADEWSSAARFVARAPNEPVRERLARLLNH